MVITGLDKKNINKERQLLLAQLPKAERGQYGPLYVTIGCFLKGDSTKKNVILNKISNCFSLCYYMLCHALSMKGHCVSVTIYL